MLQCKEIEIGGIVQGVGFRPFVYRLAQAHQLVGSVSNQACGVCLCVQGQAAALSAFIRELTDNPPPLSRIDALKVTPCEPKPLHEFAIEPSSAGASTYGIALAADQGICADCIADLQNPDSRFYQYPFTNCSHCGPRYSIIKALPYDRANTSMQGFAMCPECLADYQNPLDRRYHAQPISCPNCGPQLSFLNAGGQLQSGAESALVQAAKAIEGGAIIAIKGLGGFHLACDAKQAAAVAELRRLKRRERKPLAVMAANLEQARQLVVGQECEWQALQSQAAPIVLMHKAPSCQTWVADNVAPHVACLGVMLPYTPLHQLLLSAVNRPLVMTSANLSGASIASQSEAVLAAFGQTENGFTGVLDHNRPIQNSCDDSLVQLAGGKMRVLRLARGLAPLSRVMASSDTGVLSMGAQQKASLALALGDRWLLSPYLGDIDDFDTFTRYHQALDELLQLYRIKPQLRVCDAHPGYASSQLAEQLSEVDGCQLLKVQHHHAHILAVMAEHHLSQPVLGFAFDGTGWGDDRSVWGGEVLLCSPNHIRRVGRLRSFRLIGGEAAIKQPARIALALLLELYSLDAIKQMRLKVFQHWDEAHLDNLFQLWTRGCNSPYTSSMGRLIDGLAALAGLVKAIDYEGESGLRMELAALKANSAAEINFVVDDSGVMDWQPLVEFAIDSAPVRQAEFCQGVLGAIAQLVLSVAQNYPEHPVALGGGVFQNRWLMDQIHQLWPDDWPIYSGEQLPVNDGGIAAGQLWYALHQQGDTAQKDQPQTDITQ